MPLHEWLPEGHVPLDIPGIPAVALHSTRALLTLAHQGQRAPDMQVPTSILEQESERLLRIFYVLDTAFMRYREATWHMCIRNIKINGGHIIIDEDERKTDRWNGWWSTFPNHINAMKDGPVKASVLATGACHDTGHMVKLMEHLFDGMHFTFEELLIRLKPTHARTMLVNSCSPLTSNLTSLDVWVVRLTSHVTQRTWALHLSGAQYHNYAIGTFWDDFADHHVSKVLTVRPLGTLSQYSHALSQSKTVSGMQHDLQLRAMQAFHSTIDPAMAKKNLRWRDVRDKPQDDFVRHADKILGVGKRAVEAFIKAEGALTKRRQKAERWEKRHGDEAIGEQETVTEEILGYWSVKGEKKGKRKVAEVKAEEGFDGTEVGKRDD